MTEPDLPPVAYGTPGQRPSSPLFEFNRPTVIAMVYLTTPFFILTAVIGVALAYAWRADLSEGEGWEWTHYTYHIRTFWLSIGVVAGAILLLLASLILSEAFEQSGGIFLAMAGIFAVLLVLALLVMLAVRCVFALIRAQSREPIPRPRTLLV